MTHSNWWLLLIRPVLHLTSTVWPVIWWRIQCWKEQFSNSNIWWPVFIIVITTIDTRPVLRDDTMILTSSDVNPGIDWLTQASDLIGIYWSVISLDWSQWRPRRNDPLCWYSMILILIFIISDIQWHYYCIDDSVTDYSDWPVDVHLLLLMIIIPCWWWYLNHSIHPLPFTFIVDILVDHSAIPRWLLFHSFSGSPASFGSPHHDGLCLLCLDHCTDSSGPYCCVASFTDLGSLHWVATPYVRVPSPLRRLVPRFLDCRHLTFARSISGLHHLVHHGSPPLTLHVLGFPTACLFLFLDTRGFCLLHLAGGIHCLHLHAFHLDHVTSFRSAPLRSAVCGFHTCTTLPGACSPPRLPLRSFSRSGFTTHLSHLRFCCSSPTTTLPRSHTTFLLTIGGPGSPHQWVP